jgi:hypothetical protein
MGNNRPFSKLKKTIEALFVPELRMEFCCNSYPMRESWNPTNAIPRFYVKLGKEIMWDYPKEFPVKDINYGWWAGNNNISDLVREYIDTSVQLLLTKSFTNEVQVYQTYGTESRTITVEYHLIELFIAADRRLGKEKLKEWAAVINNPKVDLILEKRF